MDNAEREWLYSMELERLGNIIEEEAGLYIEEFAEAIN